MKINPKKDWKVKLVRAYFSKVQSGKMTVWDHFPSLVLNVGQIAFFLGKSISPDEYRMVFEERQKLEK